MGYIIGGIQNGIYKTQTNKYVLMETCRWRVSTWGISVGVDFYLTIIFHAIYSTQYIPHKTKWDISLGVYKMGNIKHKQVETRQRHVS